MPGSKKSYIKSKADSKLLVTRVTLRVLILALGVTVIYDSFIHNTPLFYILFYILGRIAGNTYRLIFSIERKENEKYEVRSNHWSIAIAVTLFAIRHLVGKHILESFNVIYATDAIYLFFIGLYYTKWKVVIKKIDEVVYEKILKNEM